MEKVIVLGGKGQLGQALQSLTENRDLPFEFLYMTSNEVDITNSSQIDEVFKIHQPRFVINCAAYTAVDLAETEKDEAFLINGYAMKGVAEMSEKYNSILIHISTDFVFENVAPNPLKEEDKTIPSSVYGASKLLGEQLIQQTASKYFIIRTSWLYSEFQNNFVKTMLRLGKERKSLSVVYDQVGSPTYAIDLANAILQIITHNSDLYGIYHYSNEGVCSWYDFAFQIFKQKNIPIELLPIESNQFPTPAKRPNYSVLSKDKIKNNLNIETRHWTISLNECLAKL